MTIRFVILGYVNLVLNCCLIKKKGLKWRIIKMIVNVDNYSCINSSKKKSVPNVINKRYVPSFVRNVRIVTV